MGRVFTITNSNNFAEGVRKKTIKKEIVIGPTAIKFVAIAIFAILAVVYLAQSTSGANRSVKIRDLEGEKAQMQLEKEGLEVEQTRLRSLKGIDNGVEKPPLEPVSSVDHVGSNSLAIAKIN